MSDLGRVEGPLDGGAHPRCHRRKDGPAKAPVTGTDRTG